ncbi:MAG: hypothetical protein J0H09_09655, partial [Burkholderiales bacterium]|nr:hypothetical protein [Burkholderiales bacterium]
MAATFRVTLNMQIVCDVRVMHCGELQTIGGHLVQGHTAAAQTAVEGLVHRAVNPAAPFSYLYRGGQIAGAL